MNAIREALHAYLFVIPVIVLVLCEIAKTVMEGMRTGRWQARIFQPGGMPSTHSAFVTSLLIIVWRRTGPTSVEFAIAFCFACVMWYDAMSSRRAIGEQAHIINRLQHWKHLTERLGHTGREVLAGITFGAAVTVIGIWIG